MKVLITGANGFVGRALCAEAVVDGWDVCAVTRAQYTPVHGVDSRKIATLDGLTDWTGMFFGCQVVCHLAARVHVMSDASINSLDAFRQVNLQGSLNLARQAAAAGIRRFVFISSIGVNGAVTFQQPFTAHDEVAPHSPYAVSKFEAEVALQALAAETGMEVVIIRPPLVYGPNAPGNFGSLMRWLQLGIPLPLGAIHNQRSLVALDNLVDLVMTCLTHPAAANQTFLVSDGEDVSTTDLLRRMGKAMQRPAHLIPVPASFLQGTAALLGKRDLAQRLCGSLQVDIKKTRQLLGWNPPLTLAQGLRKAAEGIGS